MERCNASVTSCNGAGALLAEVKETLSSRTKSEAGLRFTFLTAELKHGIYVQGETLTNCAKCISDAEKEIRKENPRRATRRSNAAS